MRATSALRESTTTSAFLQSDEFLCHTSGLTTAPHSKTIDLAAPHPLHVSRALPINKAEKGQTHAAHAETVFMDGRASALSVRRGVTVLTEVKPNVPMERTSTRRDPARNLSARTVQRGSTSQETVLFPRNTVLAAFRASLGFTKELIPRTSAKIVASARLHKMLRAPYAKHAPEQAPQPRRIL